MMKCAPAAAISILLLSTACASVANTPRIETASNAPAPDASGTPDRKSPDPAAITSPTFPSLLKLDIQKLSSAPRRWDRREWRRAGLGTLAVGGALLLDEQVRSELSRPARSDVGLRGLASNIEPFGAGYSWAVLGAFYLAGRAGPDEKAMAVSQDGVAASLIAAGVITPLLKAVVGRDRPSQTGAVFYRGGGASFPSGHTTQAFAVASVIAANYDSIWVRTLAYGGAAIVGLARIQHNAHYLSDVVAGALIGSAVGRAVVRIHAAERLRLKIHPVGGRSAGLAIAVQADSSNVGRLLRSFLNGS